MIARVADPGRPDKGPTYPSVMYPLPDSNRRYRLERAAS